MTMQRSRWVSALGLVILFSTIYVAVFHVRDIQDWIALRGYQAPAQIAQFATDTGMNPDGRRLLYVTKPLVDNKESFRQHCPVIEATIVLGCYTGNNIFILRVDDSRLAGVMQVTAAHEMLHAAYDRLSSRDRTRVDRLLQSAFETVENPRIQKVVAAYRERDPNVVNNELHSILGTEVSNLGPELESYYQRYFRSRSDVVKLAQQYAAVFEKMESDVDTYDKQLVELKTQIEELEPKVAAQFNTVDAERKRIESLLAAGNITQYNASIPGFNAQVNAYNAQVNKLAGLVNNYNRIVAVRNSIATTQRELTEELRTDYQTVEKQ